MSARKVAQWNRSVWEIHCERCCRRKSQAKIMVSISNRNPLEDVPSDSIQIQRPKLSPRLYYNANNNNQNQSFVNAADGMDMLATLHLPQARIGLFNSSWIRSNGLANSIAVNLSLHRRRSLFKFIEDLERQQRLKPTILNNLTSINREPLTDDLKIIIVTKVNRNIKTNQLMQVSTS